MEERVAFVGSVEHVRTFCRCFAGSGRLREAREVREPGRVDFVGDATKLALSREMQTGMLQQQSL